MKTRIELMKKALFLFCVLTFSLSASAQEAEVKKAMRYLDIIQPSKAIETMNQAIKAYPENNELYYYLGYIYLKTGDKGQALKTFEKGVSVNPDKAINHVGLGAIRMAEGKANEAKPFFDKALSMSKSKDAKVLQAVAEASLVDVKYAEGALKHLEKAKALNPTDPKTFMLMGEADLLQNKGGPSITNCENAARLDPSNGKPWYNIALVYQRSQNFPLAEENFKKAISVDPEFTLAYKELGESYYSMKEGEKAAKMYESYLKLKENPTDQDQLRYAFFLFMAKDYAKANTIFKTLAEKPDATATTLKYYAYSLVEAGDLPGAQKMFEKYFSVNADKVEASDYNYFGKLLQKLKNDSLAVVNYKKSLTLTPEQPEIAELVAETLFKLRKYNETIEAYKVLFKLRENPLSGDYYRLGQSYYNLEQYAQADTIFTKFVEKQSTISVSYLWLGRTKAALDPDAKLDMAKAAYDKVIELASTNLESNGNKSYVIEAYKYLGFYFSQRDNLDQAKAYMEKVLTLNPTDQQALDFLKALKAPK
jgi:tetratricopeptide (TPR) repeat protein